MYQTGIEQDGASSIASGPNLGSSLMQMLSSGQIEPGHAPSYNLCKQIHAYHPLGAILTDAPITRSQSKPRDISVTALGEERIVEQFVDTWNRMGRVGATIILHNLVKTSRIYGIASLGVGERGKELSTPLDLNAIVEEDLFFNVLDPLNTAGSLVLNQDPNSPDFLKPDGNIAVNGKVWHPSRLFVKMNEQPIYIEWTASSFGFVGRSVYQRALFSLKTYLLLLVTYQMVARKAGLLVAKMESPGSIIDKITKKFFGDKRAQLKEGVTNQVLGIGTQESIETLNMQNLDKAGEFSRANTIKDIASACGMPASIIAQETLTEGFGEGTEDAKKEAAYLEYIQEDMAPAYAFMDRIVMRKAWTREFYETLKPDYPQYKKVPYEVALHQWIRGFRAKWPNLLMEPDSERSKHEKVKLEAVIAVVEAVAPLCDPESKARIIGWVAENCNNCEDLFSGMLDVDEDKLRDWLEENAASAQAAMSAVDKPEPRPRPFSAAS